jgi:hypothetical protein
MAFIGNGAQLTDLDAGDIASGTLPLARGGTGTTNTVNTVVAGSGISVSTSGTQVTVSSSGGGGVTSLNGQTGAITNTDFAAIGSYLVGFLRGTTSQVSIGGTASGSNLRYNNNFDGNITTNASVSATAFAFAAINSYSGTSVSGTWRRMSTGHQTYSPSCCGERWPAHLWVRIS